MKNTSLLPQKITFIKLPPEITIAPNKGFALLLPNESIEFMVSYFPAKSIGDRNFQITLSSSANQTYKVKIRGTVKECPLKMPFTALSMHVTSGGSSVVEYITLQNISTQKCSFHVAPPPWQYSWIRVSPSSGLINGRSSCRIQISFSPPAEITTADPRGFIDQFSSSNESRDKDVEPFDCVSEGDRWISASNVYGDFRVAKTSSNYHLPNSTALDGEDSQESDSGLSGREEMVAEEPSLVLPPREWGISSAWNVPIFFRSDSLPLSRPLFLRLSTVVALPSISCDRGSVDFGAVVVGSRLLQSVVVTNTSDRPLDLQASALNEGGPFTLLIAMRALGPGDQLKLLLECKPLRGGHFVDDLCITAKEGGQRLTIALKCESVSPVIEVDGVEPLKHSSDPLKSVLDFKNIVVSDVISKKFKVVNKSGFEVHILIKRASLVNIPPSKQSAHIQRNAFGQALVSFSPENFFVGSNSSVEIECIFRPTSPSRVPCVEELLVLAGDHTLVRSISLVARFWGRQLITVPVTAVEERFLQSPATLSHDFDESMVTSADARLKLDQAQGDIMGINLNREADIVLTFPDPFAESSDAKTVSSLSTDGNKGKVAKPNAVTNRSQVKKLIVQSIKMSESRQNSGNTGSFELLLSKEIKECGLFSFNLEKGNVAAGASSTIEVTCSQAEPKGIGGLVVGSWKSYAFKILLRGGFVIEGDPEDTYATVMLRAFVRL